MPCGPLLRPDMTNALALFGYGPRAVIRDWMTEVVSWKGGDASSDDLRHLDVALDERRGCTR
jgi:hypothetical protein